jgi:biotin operon repressor
MAQIREILYRTIQGDSGRKIGRSLGISRTSVRKYLDIASKQFGFTVNTPVAAIDQIALQVELC